MALKLFMTFIVVVTILASAKHEAWSFIVPVFIEFTDMNIHGGDMHNDLFHTKRDISYNNLNDTKNL